MSSCLSGLHPIRSGGVGRIIQPRVHLLNLVSMTDLQHKRSLWIGVLFASLVVPITLIFNALISQARAPSSANLLIGIGGIFVIATPVSFLATTVLGLPFVLLLRALKILNWTYVCVGASLIGVLIDILLVWLVSGELTKFPQGLLAGFIGLVSGAAFCLGVRPEHSLKPQPLRSSG